ncbi:hypothetical protein ACHAWF_014260 [Thalassiosira exigua]
MANRRHQRPHQDDDPDVAVDLLSPCKTIEARPQGFSIDVRIFLAIVAAAMALAFAAGMMIGPTSLVDPALALLGIPLPPLHGEDGAIVAGRAGGPKIGTGGEDASSVAGDPSGTSENAREALITADGQIVSSDGDSKVIKIKETHVNIDEPVLEGQGEVPRLERDVRYLNASQDDEEGGFGASQLRDQTNPSGQHLLIDIKNLEADFLNSETRLAEAMQDSVKEAGLTMLSYHCHSLHPAGVSCVGVLLESHISFHTWPDEGVITRLEKLDLFTTSEKPLLPSLPKIEELFAVPRVNAETGEEETPVTMWSHELRGFRTEDAKKAHYLDGDSDLAAWITSPLEVQRKTQVASMQTEHQRIDVWDSLEREETPSYEDGLRLGLKAGDPRWLTNEHATPARMFFLDGRLMSFRGAEHQFHESLVQPAMFAHPHPKRVGIIGGGEGASLREVLRHKSVRAVKMIERDEKVVEVAREHLPSFNDCSDIKGSTNNCFDDPRAEIIYADAFKYLLEEQKANMFDVLVVDGMDPEMQDEYADPAAIDAVVRSLTSNGTVSFSIGMAPAILDPRADKGINPKRELLIKHLDDHPLVNSIHVYEEGHCGFTEPRAFLVACRDVSCRSRWYAETDEVDYQIYERLGGTKSGKPNLVHWDGATQRSFRAPPKAWESIYCRREPTPFECAYRGLDLRKDLYEFNPDDEEESAFEISPIKYTNNDGKEEDGVAVYAKVDIPEGSYVMPTHLAASFEVSDASMENVRGAPKAEVEGLGKAEVVEDFIDFVDDHGHRSLQEGIGRSFVEVGGTFLVRTEGEGGAKGAANVRRWIPPHPSGASRPKWSPVYDRHRHSFDVFIVASRNIKKGEELVKPPGLWE